MGVPTSTATGEKKRRVFLPAAAIAGAVVALDQGTKIWATSTLSSSPPVTVISNFFHLTYHRNTGMVFGLLSGPPSVFRQAFFIAATLAALVFIGYLLRDWGRESRIALAGLGMIGGGAVGNLIDRIIYGEVVDFIDWHWYSRHWPTFNVADGFITVGTVLLFAVMLLRPGIPSGPR
jgi:signal peptidase II